MTIKLFADGAAVGDLGRLIDDVGVAGFTTNPTLMKKSGVTDYLGFAVDMLASARGLPVSFEVFADDFGEMEAQAKTLHALAENVFVKIPITDTLGNSSTPLVGRLHASGVKVNVTAVFTPAQIDAVIEQLSGETEAIVSVFAGRIADAGIDPVPTMAHAVAAAEALGNVEVLWASPREIFNLVQAEHVGADIITVPPDLLDKRGLIGKDLVDFSLETVRMFRDDAVASGFEL